MNDVMNTKDIISVILSSFQKKRKIKIYYPKTTTRKEGWREIAPQSISTDLHPHGEQLVPVGR